MSAPEHLTLPSDGADMNVTAAALVADARQRVQALSPSEFATEMDRGDAVVIDLREAEERVSDGSIPGSVHIPRGMLEFRADPTSAYYDSRLQQAARVLLYCASGGRSALAATTLASLGYASVAHLDCGVRAWMEAGMPVVGRQTEAY